MKSYHRASIGLKKEDYRQLEMLMKYFDENRSQVFKRALMGLYAEMLKRKDFLLFANEENRK